MKVFSWVKSRSNLVEPLPLKNYLEKEQFYETMGYKSEEQKQKLFAFRNQTMCNYIDAGLPLAKFFEVDKVEKRLMLLTDCPKSSKILRFVRMPFKSIFLDIDIDASELPKQVTDEGVSAIHGLLLMEINATDEKMDKVIDHSVTMRSEGAGKILYCAYCVEGLSSDGHQVSGIYDLMIPVDDWSEETVKYDKVGKQQLRFFRNFVINLLLFIEHPDVEIRYFERTMKSQERRIREHKMVLPSSNRIRLSGKLKRYVYDMQSSLGDGFDFAFFVRGHWRVHHSERYVNMQGKIIWIQPFLKGSGELRDSTYSVEADKEQEKEYSDKFLFLDDIQPLDKPLRDIKNEGGA
jgi:hypothetical protein